MKDQRLVSVIMPAYNSEAFIAEAIDSVIAQTYENWELIIVDDASTDTTLKIVNAYHQQDLRIRSIRNSTNRGTHISRNKAIEAANGDFIAFLDADDLWKPEKLQDQLKILLDAKFNACFSSYELITENGRSTEKMVMALPYLDYKKLLKANYVGNLTGIYNARKLGKIYCPDIRKRQDWGLWLKVIKKGGPMKGVEEPLAAYRMRKDSISTNKIEMLRYNFAIYHKVLGYGLFRSLWKMLIFLREQLFIKTKQIRPISEGK